jgi:nucleoside-diphosphate-sugar epimerase
MTGDLADKVDFLRGDIADRTTVDAAIKGCDYVFHVAAKAGVWGTWEEYVRINIAGTSNVVLACQAQGVRVLVHTSTPSVVFNGEAFRGADESLPYGDNWLCAYAETKAIAEDVALKAASDKLKVCALRPHLIWGPGDNHLFPRVLARARAGKLRIVGDGENQVDVTHVDTAADAHLGALDALLAGRANGKAYFLSQGEPVKLWVFINRLLVGAGEKPITKRISQRAAYWLGALLEGAWTLFRLKGEPPMTRFVAVELAKDHWFDVSAARRDLCLKPAVDTWAELDRLAATLRTK